MLRRRTLAAWIAAGAAAGLLASGQRVPAWEVATVRWWNAAPRAIALGLWPVMQLGTLWGAVLVAAALFVALRRGAVALAAGAAGVAAWWTAKVLKQVWQRPRPLCCIADLDLRGATSSGFGFPSGHSAVAASCAVVVMSCLPRRWRWVPVVLAAGVGVSRMVHGAHFPVDLVGGWAVGVAAGMVALTVLRRLELLAPTETGANE